MGLEQLRKDSVRELSEKKAYETQQKNAATIAFVVLAEGGKIDNVTASEQAALFAEWSPSINYTVGQLRRYRGILYRCVQDHQSQEGWEPDKTASLWNVTSDPAEPWPEWSQPIGVHDAYSKDAKTSHNGKRWVSDIDNNVWEPGVYGWTEYVDPEELHEVSQNPQDGLSEAPAV